MSYYPVYYLIIKTAIFTISINETEAMQLNSKMDLNDDDDTFDPLFLSVLKDISCKFWCSLLLFGRHL